MYLLLIAFFICLCGKVNAQQPNPPGQVTDGEAPVNEAYLFAHMTKDDYGSLYLANALPRLVAFISANDIF